MYTWYMSISKRVSTPLSNYSADAQQIVRSFLEPVQSLASKSETRRKQLRKQNVQAVHEHFEAVFNALV
ncbi:hypothetical protein VI26_14105 [Chromobacterium sp. LK1]|nr:hypothetical protein VI26_14105 [Chromobacterium sp. LK1]